MGIKKPPVFKSAVLEFGLRYLQSTSVRNPSSRQSLENRIARNRNFAYSYPNISRAYVDCASLSSHASHLGQTRQIHQHHKTRVVYV
jgi:hypothetical protein